MRAGLQELAQLRLKIPDHAGIVRSAADARWREEDFQLATHLANRFVQLLAQGLFRVRHSTRIGPRGDGRHIGRCRPIDPRLTGPAGIGRAGAQGGFSGRALSRAARTSKTAPWRARALSRAVLKAKTPLPCWPGLGERSGLPAQAWRAVDTDPGLSWGDNGVAAIDGADWGSVTGAVGPGRRPTRVHDGLTSAASGAGEPMVRWVRVRQSGFCGPGGSTPGRQRVWGRDQRRGLRGSEVLKSS